MNTSTGKLLSVFSVHLRSWGAMALPVREIRLDMNFGEKMNRVLSRSHIYLLCKRPAFSFDPGTFSWSGNQVNGDLVCKVKGVTKSFPFAFGLPLQKNEATVVLTPSHHEIHTLNADGQCIRRLSAMGLSQHPDILQKDRSANDLEVLYIGNVFSEENVPIFERICRDKLLQRFMEAMQQALPDDDVIVYTFEYLPYELVTLPARFSPNREKETGKARFRSIRKYPLSEYEKICLAEAGLIHYFQPVWQEKGKDTLPHPGQVVFEACKTLDFAGLVVELSTVRSHFRLFTPHSALLPHHMTMIDLSDPGKRKAFFAMKV